MGLEEIGICLVIIPIAIIMLVGFIQITITVIKVWKENPLSDAVVVTGFYIIGLMLLVGIVLIAIG